MEKHVEHLPEDGTESQISGVIFAIFAIIVTLVLFALWRRRSSVGQSVLLVGLSDAGKTLLFARLLHSNFVQTHTSLKENIGDITVNNKSLKLVDIPGAERLRYNIFDKYKSLLRGIIFVIDSVTIQQNIRDAAEFLYTLLTDSALQKNVPLLILCNKQDQTLAKGSSAIQTLLEREMNLLRITKTNQLEATDASSTNAYLGKDGKDFEFFHLTTKVDFAECGAFVQDDDTPADIEGVHNWLQKLV